MNFLNYEWFFNFNKSTVVGVCVGAAPSPFYSSPDCEMTMGSFGLLLGPVGTFSIFLIINSPSKTRPNTTCLLSRKLHLAHVIKNWHPFVSLPLFAIDRSPGESCFNEKFSSANVPKIKHQIKNISPKKLYKIFSYWASCEWTLQKYLHILRSRQCHHPVECQA